MKIRISSFMAGPLILFGFFGAAISAELLSGPLAARIVRVIDGDTLVVRVHIWLDQDVETRVRLFGIDTPEIRGKCREERCMALDATALLQSGLARPYDGGERLSWCNT